MKWVSVVRKERHPAVVLERPCSVRSCCLPPTLSCLKVQLNLYFCLLAHETKTLEMGKGVGHQGENTLQAEPKMEMNPLGDGVCSAYVHFQGSSQQSHQGGGGKEGRGRVGTDRQSLKKWPAAGQARIMSDKSRD